MSTDRNTSRRRIPTLRRHTCGQATVRLNGRDYYLGRWGTPRAQAAYDRLIARWLANDRRPLPDDADGPTIAEVLAAFWRFAQGHYLDRQGEPTTSLDNYRRLIAIVNRMYGDTPAADFGPSDLKLIRSHLVGLDWSRGVVNQAVGMIRFMIRWAGGEELVPPAVVSALDTVPGLKAHRSPARETEPVKPVPDAHIEAVRPFVSAQVWALIQLQLLTGARAGELVQLRAIDLDTSGRVWVFEPQQHKGAHREKPRRIYLGPQAQRIAAQWLQGRGTHQYLFSPAEAEQARHAAAETHRRPDSGDAPKTDRKLGERYTTHSYRRAIHYACDRAFPPPDHLARRRVPGSRGRERWETVEAWRDRLGPDQWAELLAWRRDHRWNPHQLRHNAATAIRKRYGLEASAVILGHAKADVTQIYAEADESKALKIAMEVG